MEKWHTNRSGSAFALCKKDDRKIIFSFPHNAVIASKSVNVTEANGELAWPYQWEPGETWKFMLSMAGDSAENFTLYSAYVMVPSVNKWKLIGTCKLNSWMQSIQSPSSFRHSFKKADAGNTVSDVWFQRLNGSWKNMLNAATPPPTINLISHLDSTQQLALETIKVKDAIQAGKTDATKEASGIFYAILQEGSGNMVAVTDTVVVHYKGYCFANGQVFDQTTEKPATFPLSRLIRGWQVGLSLCRVGGKIKLIIPSAMGYSIRTRSAKIPPNSTLVFEITVLDAKPAR